jgi:geranylgeranyl diphosphate synthase type I
MAGGQESEERAVGAAVAVEMVHDASLIHDDISDDDRMRRHRPAAWDVFGTGVALSAATCLFPLAADQLMNRDDVAELDRAVRQTYEGQVDDCSFERRDDVTLAEYLVMVEKKVGALMEAACVLGARAGGATQAQQEHYRTFGRRLGTAYMVSDDLLGIWSEASVSGKPQYSDLITRKKTAPVLEAITRSSEICALYAGDTPLDPATAARIAVLIEECGARAWAEAEAERWLVLALESLDSAAAGAADTEALTALRTLAQAAVRRNR